MAISQERNSAWQLGKYYRRRARMLELLGGECVWCGVDKELEIDHIDPTTKSFSISKYFTKPWDDLVKELSKCQILCTTCHKKKSIRYSEVPHGGGKYGKHHCPCVLCKARRAEYMKEYSRTYRARRKALSNIG